MEIQGSLHSVVDGGLWRDQELIQTWALNTVVTRLETLSNKFCSLLMKISFLSVKGGQQFWEADIPEV